MSKRSVVSFHTGQAGIQIGKSIWELYNFEHDIQNDGSRNFFDPDLLGSNVDNFRTFYYETANGKYVPKALFVDSEPSCIDDLSASSVGAMIHQDYMVSSNQDCRNIMGLAWYPTFLGSNFHAKIIQQCRRVKEHCDALSGAFYHLSTCGGTGTGLSCRLLESMRNDDPKSINYTVAETTAPSICGNPLETHNTIAYMGITRYDNLYMNMIIMCDNEALYRQANKIHRTNKSLRPSYEHLNQLIAFTMSSCTASLRFDGQLNVDLGEFQTNLVPIPTLNNMFQSFAPLLADENKEAMTTRDITQQAFLPEAYQCSVDPFAYANKWVEEETEETWPTAPWMEEADAIKRKLEGENRLVPKDQWTINHKFLGCCVMYRGDLMPSTINRAMRVLTESKSPQFVSWVPAGFKVGINSPPLRSPATWKTRDMSRSLTCLMNNTVISEKLKQLVRNYRYLTELQGYDVWTAIGGIEASLLESCKQGLVDQISQYEYCMATQVAIDEIQQVLEGRPQPLGKY